MADAIDLIKEDHRTVEGLFEKIEGSGDGAPEERHDLVREAIRELVVHASIEERVLYPVMREALEGGDALVDEHIDDHSQVEELLKELEDGDPASTEYDRRGTPRPAHTRCGEAKKVADPGAAIVDRARDKLEEDR